MTTPDSKNKIGASQYDEYSREELIAGLIKSTAEIKTLKENPKTVNNINNTNNTNNINNINIIVPPDLSKTDTFDYIQKILPNLMHNALSKHPCNFISYMIRETNCNPSRPLFNCVKITNKNNDLALVSDGTKYVNTTKSKIISQLIDNKRGILQEYVDTNGDKYMAKILNRYQSYVDALDDDKKIMKDLENDVICMLLDISAVIGKEDWSKKLLEDLNLWKNVEEHTSVE